MSLKVWLPLISDTNSIGLIREGITPHNISTYSASKFGTAAQLNGSSGYIDGSVYTTATMTYMCWVYFDTLKGCHLLDCRNASGTGYQPMYINPSSGVQVGGSTSAYPYIAYTFAAAKWYHVAVTYSATKCQLFVNGALAGESTSGRGTAINANMPFYLGCRCTQVNWTHGRINDFRIYDHTCSAKEIAEIARGLFLHYKFDGFYEGTVNRIPASSTMYNGWNSYGYGGKGVKTVLTGPTPNGTNIYCQVTSNSSTAANVEMAKGVAATALEQGGKLTASAYVRGNGSAIGRSGFLTVYNSNGTDTQSTKVVEFTFTSEWQRVSGQFTWNKTTTSNTNFNLYVVGNIDSSMTYEFCEPQFEMKDHVTPYTEGTRAGETAIADCSGYGNNGSIIGEVENSNVTKRYSRSTYINSPNATDGTTEGAYYIDAPCNLGNPQTISVTWWCNPIAGYSSATANGIWCTTANGTGSDYTVSAFNHRDIAFNVNSADGTQHLRPSTSSMATSEWHHYALVYNGRTATFYKDGVSQTSASFTADTALGNMTKLLIGISRAGGVNRKVKAYYSDFRVYVTALTAQQIKDLYNEQAAISRTAAIFTREIVEDSSIAVTHNGQLTANSFQETGTTAFFKKNGTVKGSDIYEY